MHECYPMQLTLLPRQESFEIPWIAERSCRSLCCWVRAEKEKNGRVLGGLQNLYCLYFRSVWGYASCFWRLLPFRSTLGYAGHPRDYLTPGAQTRPIHQIRDRAPLGGGAKRVRAKNTMDCGMEWGCGVQLCRQEEKPLCLRW